MGAMQAAQAVCCRTVGKHTNARGQVKDNLDALGSDGAAAHETLLLSREEDEAQRVLEAHAKACARIRGASEVPGTSPFGWLPRSHCQVGSHRATRSAEGAHQTRFGRREGAISPRV